MGKQISVYFAYLTCQFYHLYLLLLNIHTLYEKTYIILLSLGLAIDVCCFYTDLTVFSIAYLLF